MTAKVARFQAAKLLAHIDSRSLGHPVLYELETADLDHENILGEAHPALKILLAGLELQPFEGWASQASVTAF